MEMDIDTEIEEHDFVASSSHNKDFVTNNFVTLTPNFVTIKMCMLGPAFWNFQFLHKENYETFVTGDAIS